MFDLDFKGGTFWKQSASTCLMNCSVQLTWILNALNYIQQRLFMDLCTLGFTDISNFNASVGINFYKHQENFEIDRSLYLSLCMQVEGKNWCISSWLQISCSISRLANPKACSAHSLKNIISTYLAQDLFCATWTGSGIGKWGHLKWIKKLQRRLDEGKL